MCSGDGQLARAHDSALLPCDSHYLPAQIVDVVAGDGGDDRQLRGDGVGCVVTAAQANLENGKLHAGPGKVEERQGGDGFEEAAAEEFGIGPDLAYEAGDLLPGGLCTIDPHPLTEAAQL